MARSRRVFMSGSGQHVTIPVQYRLTTNEVYVPRSRNRRSAVAGPCHLGGGLRRPRQLRFSGRLPHRSNSFGKSCDSACLIRISQLHSERKISSRSCSFGFALRRGSCLHLRHRGGTAVRSSQVEQWRAAAKIDWFLAPVSLCCPGTEMLLRPASCEPDRNCRQTLAPLNTQIAAHAIASGATLVTNDRAFSHVSGLSGIENWATDL